MLGTKLIPVNWDSKWNNLEPFEIHTSGSTGIPKPHLLDPKLIRWSAEQTRKHYIRSKNAHQLIALPIEKVGGFMQWARAKTWNAPFDIVKPSTNPLLEYEGLATISSLTPMQIEGILSNPKSYKKLGQFESILIGGAPISGEIEERLLHEFPGIYWVHTFGMTETYSHFAGRPLGNQLYTVIDHTEIDQTEVGLRVKNPCTQNKWIQTHDIVKILEANCFIWEGRSDFTINSGGVKIQLETVEREIAAHTNWPFSEFFCWWEADKILGQKLVLFIKDSLILPSDWHFLSRFYQPKSIYRLKQLLYTKTGKIARKESANQPSF